MTYYLRFNDDGIIKYFTRVEGQRPLDTNYLGLAEYMDENKDGIQSSKIQLLTGNENIYTFDLMLNDKKKNFNVMPSKLTEIANNEITEVVIDSIDNKEEKIVKVYKLIRI